VQELLTHFHAIAKVAVALALFRLKHLKGMPSGDTSHRRTNVWFLQINQ